MLAFTIPEAQPEKKKYSKPTARKTPAVLRTATEDYSLTLTGIARPKEV